MKTINVLHTGNEYRPMPFWSWNDKLQPDRIKEQIVKMHEQGIGGFVIHARSGLMTEYMKEEWFNAVDIAVQKANELGMLPWVYDENGWPSGFGDGLISGRGVKYQQKYLRMEKGKKHTASTICNVDGYHFYYEVNPFYVDNLDVDVVHAFLQEIYESYYQRYRNNIQGFFTDEPQLSRDGIPWGFTIPDAYEKEYGEKLLPKLPELYVETGEYVQTRLKYWRLITKLFRDAYAKQIGDWCRARGLKLTGHLVLEETVESQMTTNGACMPSYQYFDIPGIDWLGGEKKDILSGANIPLTFKQIESVAHQFGKKKVLTETFAAAGHDISFSEMRGLLEWQMVRGITIVCPHLQGYSTRGMRKRDFPPAMGWQQPWWDEYKKQNDYLARVGCLLSEGEASYDTLLLHNQSSAWVHYAALENQGTDKEQKILEEALLELEKKHVLFHLGDELILEENAYVEENALIVGKQRYHTVVLMEDMILFEQTKVLLQQFKACGGEVVEVADVKENRVIDNPNILYTKRRYGEKQLHYFVNKTAGEQMGRDIPGEFYLNPTMGEWVPFSGSYHFQINDSLITIEGETIKNELSKPVKPIDDKWQMYSQKWSLKSVSDNALLLDFCDYYFDGVLQEKDGYILNILERACRLKKPIKIDMLFRVDIEKVPTQLYLAVENWEQYQISVNGKMIQIEDEGYYIEESIRKINIRDQMKKGTNEIKLTVDFVQTEEFYENLDKAYQFESEKNKIVYPMEIEAIYLVGNFGVWPDYVEPYGIDWCKTSVGFHIGEKPEYIQLDNIEQQGFPFFAGAMHLKSESPDRPAYWKIEMSGIQTVELRTNQKTLGCAIWNGEILNEGDEVKKEKTEVELVLKNTLRNLWGPHHYKEKNKITAWPSYFYQEPGLSGCIDRNNWEEGYVLRTMSVKLSKKCE